MNVFNTYLDEMMDEMFSPLNVKTYELQDMRSHWCSSKYSRMYIDRAWRDVDGVLCVEYDDCAVVKYGVSGIDYSNPFSVQDVISVLG